HETLIAKGDVAGMGVPEAEPNAEELQLSLESDDQLSRRVRAAIEQLPPGQREVVKLHKLRGMSMADIAQRLGVRPGALRVRAHRAYKAPAGPLLPQGDDAAVSHARCPARPASPSPLALGSGPRLWPSALAPPARWPCHAAWWVRVSFPPRMLC